MQPYDAIPLIAAFVVLALPANVPSHTALQAPTPAYTLSGTHVSAPSPDHPRLWITTADLPRLRSWATDSNPMFKHGLHVALNAAIGYYNSKFFPGGMPNPKWPDGGTSNFELYATEAYAQFFAFMSLVDPDANARILHATRARNLLMHAIHEAAKGPAANQPFRDQQFITYNRGNWWGEAWGLTVDWIYNAVDASDTPILTTQDKAAIRSVFMQWSNQLITAYGHPNPVGVINSPALLSNSHADTSFRWAANNYFMGHARNMTLMALSIDPADDPPISPTLAITALGNTLRSYFTNVTGAWLYQQYAMYEDAPRVIADYHLAPDTPGLGMASGGLSVEGFLYGHALGYLMEGLLAMHTAGYDDPSLVGPQINLLHSTYWDKVVDGYLHSITPVSYNIPGYTWMGPIYQMMSYGDVQHFYITPDTFDTFGALGTFDYMTGNTARLQKIRWFTTNVLQGGLQKLYTRAGDNIWGNALTTDAIFYFLLYDPTAQQPQAIADPRPALSTTFYSPAIGRLLARTDWTPKASWFSMKCGWETINHQIADCFQFEFYRKGEWLTKEHTSYSNEGVLLTSDFHNSLSLQNHCICPNQPKPGQPADLQWFEGPSWDRGSQWTNGQNAGDPSNIASWSKTYAYEFADGTQLYNRPSPYQPANAALDITHASRSALWLMPDVVVVYDRADSRTSGFKRFSLNLPITPTIDITAHLSIETLPSGQKLTVQTLYPLNASITVTPVGNYGAVAEFDPIQSRLIIEDASHPKNTRFLHVLQGIDAGKQALPVTITGSISGTPFAGVVVSNTAILFPVNMGPAPASTVSGAPFTGTTYLVPGNTTRHLITGLDPNAGYGVITETAGLSLRVTILPGGETVYADYGGVLAFDTQPRTHPDTFFSLVFR